MLVIAHRGACAFAPENTIEAIEKAAQAGADAVEFDVQVAADGAVMVFHDDDLLRCTDAEVRFPDRRPWHTSDFSEAELRSLDAAGWFARDLILPTEDRTSILARLTLSEEAEWIADGDRRHYESGRVRIPRLAEALAACRRHDLVAHIELKAIPRFWPALAEKVIEEVDHHAMRRQVVLSSFDHQQLAKVRAIAHDIETAVLTTDRLYSPESYLAALRANAYNPGCYGDFDTIGFGSITRELDKATIRNLRNAGYDVNVWTENDPDRMLALINAGVSGIFTDFPNRLRAVLESAAPA